MRSAWHLWGQNRPHLHVIVQLLEMRDHEDGKDACPYLQDIRYTPNLIRFKLTVVVNHNLNNLIPVKNKTMRKLAVYRRICCVLACRHNAV